MSSTAPGLQALLEALLFIAERPLGTVELASLAGVAKREVDDALLALRDALAGGGRGLRLQRHEDAWQLVTAPELGPRLTAYAARREPPLSTAATEALAVIAYRQPCTRAEIERVRGVDSDYVLRSLVHRRLVVEVGRRDAPGRPILYGTTFDFLERFGLTSLDDLPPLAEPVAPVAQAPGEAVAIPVGETPAAVAGSDGA